MRPRPRSTPSPRRRAALLTRRPPGRGSRSSGRAEAASPNEIQARGNEIQAQRNKSKIGRNKNKARRNKNQMIFSSPNRDFSKRYCQIPHPTASLFRLSPFGGLVGLPLAARRRHLPI